MSLEFGESPTAKGIAVSMLFYNGVAFLLLIFSGIVLKMTGAGLWLAWCYLEFSPFGA